MFTQDVSLYLPNIFAYLHISLFYFVVIVLSLFAYLYSYKIKDDQFLVVCQDWFICL